MQDKNLVNIKKILLELADYLKVKGIRGLAAELGENENKLYGWIKNGSIGDTGSILGKHPNINREWLLTGEGTMLKGPEVRLDFKEPKLVPLLGKVSAGFPQLVAEDIIEYISMPDAPNNAYVLIVKGDSMSPEIRDGAYVMFIQNGEYKNGDIVVVNNEWGETMCKRFRSREGKFYLTSDNPEYPAIEPNENYRIIGRVIESWTRKKH